MAIDDFNALSKPDWPKRLYHCLLGIPHGAGLEPLTIRDVNGQTAPYLFATHVLSKSLAFNFSYMKEEILMNAGIPNTEAELAVVFDRVQVMDRPRQISVYAFDNKNFIPVENYHETRQWVSKNSVPFSDTDVVLTAKKAADLLDKGLQVFSFEPPMAYYRSLYGENFSDFLITHLRHFYDRGELVWENAARGVSPHIGALAVLNSFSLPHIDALPVRRL